MGSAITQSTISTVEEEEEAFVIAAQLASASVLPMVLKAVIELDVLETIAKSGEGAHLSPSEIAAHLPVHNSDAPKMLDRILRLLASHSVLTCNIRMCDDGRTESVYGLGRVCKFLVRNQDGVSIAPLLAMNHDKIFMQTWYRLKDAVVEGGVPFDKEFGMNAFEYPGIDARFNQVFNTGMLNHSALIMKKAVDTYKGFEQLKTLVDVGGGVGVSLNMILSKYPKIKGINYDLPHVVAEAPSHPGIQHIGGDMFVSVPSGDAIFMKWILHDWSDEHCSKLLKNCYNALPDYGKVIVVEHLLPPTPTNSLTTQCVLQLDMLMLAYNPGGKERTEKEFEALAKGAGFAGIKIVCSAYNMWVMEFYEEFASVA